MNKKTFLAAGVALALSAGAAMAQNSTPANPPAQAAGPHGGQHGGRDQGPRDGRGGEFRHGPRGEGGWGRGGHGMRHHPPFATREELQKRRADAFARMDTNKDGKVTFEEFRQDLERRRLERQREMFKRFSGGQDSVTLEQLNARAAKRFEGRGHGWGRDGADGQAPAASTGARPAR